MRLFGVTLADAAQIKANGNLVSRFWVSGDEQHLDDLGRLYQMMMGVME